mmetsp:Transcript_37869/g.67676  ORF Transcript_37869/g.67676 Transcript_37869/m.67676 type:complete len:107 (-) Transcript_37869:32-352(-)
MITSRWCHFRFHTHTCNTLQSTPTPHPHPAVNTHTCQSPNPSPTPFGHHRFLLSSVRSLRLSWKQQPVAGEAADSTHSHSSPLGPTEHGAIWATTPSTLCNSPSTH